MHLSPGHWWWRLRRDAKRGARATLGDYFVGPKIWRWRNPHAAAAPAAVPVALVLGREHVTMAAWMLASWTQATGRNWQINLHDDGTLPPDVEARFRELGLRASLVTRRAADEQLAATLARREHCRAYRQKYPLGLKIFDVPQLQTAPRFILLDPDVLFFAPPREILAWIDGAAETCWFNEDVAEASNVTAAEAEARLGVKLWPRVNSGLCLLTRRAIDLDFCERVLGETAILAGHFWRVEQTLFALCASRHGAGGLLPGAYEVSLGAHRAPYAISRHYVGAVRDHFWGEGVRELQAPLLSR